MIVAVDTVVSWPAALYVMIGTTVADPVGPPATIVDAKAGAASLRIAVNAVPLTAASPTDAVGFARLPAPNGG